MHSGGRTNAEQLLAEAREGRRASLGALLELYRNYLLLLAQTQLDLHLQGRASPSDLVQETFLQACGHFGQFRGSTEKELLGWLRRILVNNLGRLVEKQLRAGKRDARREVSLERHRDLLESSATRVEAALVSAGSSPSAQAQRRELAALVADRLARLPAAYRDVIVLRNLEGLPFDEVARRMGRTPGAVRVLWLRALDHLGDWQEGRTCYEHPS
jgi:RNA polymerase sigma-70 factor (ECF subfamily)